MKIIIKTYYITAHISKKMKLADQYIIKKTDVDMENLKGRDLF
jgi:hypothetical protein